MKIYNNYLGWDNEGNNFFVNIILNTVDKKILKSWQNNKNVSLYPCMNKIKFVFILYILLYSNT